MSGLVDSFMPLRAHTAYSSQGTFNHIKQLNPHHIQFLDCKGCMKLCIKQVHTRGIILLIASYYFAKFHDEGTNMLIDDIIDFDRQSQALRSLNQMICMLQAKTATFVSCIYL